MGHVGLIMGGTATQTAAGKAAAAKAAAAKAAAAKAAAAATKAAAAMGAYHVSNGAKFAAMGIAAVLLALVWLLFAVPSHTKNPWKLVQGADGVSSTSKFQWFLWLIVVLFVYVSLWVVRAWSGHYDAISNIPANVLVVLGFSTTTAIAAKGITVGYLNAGQISKQTGATNGSGGPQGGVMLDDSGVPELAKIQMVAFTLIAVGIFFATFVHQMTQTYVQTKIPNIDSSLLVLMGLSQGGYLGKKLVTLGSPILQAPSPNSGAPGVAVTLTGSSLGSTRGASQLLLNGQQIPTTNWTDTSIGFSLPSQDPATHTQWTKSNATLTVLVGGQTSNQVVMEVDAPG